MLESLSAYWLSKNRTDRMILLSVLFVLFFTLLWFCVFQPIKDAQLQLSKKNAQYLSLIKQLSEAENFTDTNLDSQKDNVINNKTLKINELISILAAKAQIEINSLEAVNGVVNLTLTNVNFQTLLIWLIDLHDNYSVDVETIQLLPTKNNPGFVDVKILQLVKLSS